MERFKQLCFDFPNVVIRDALRKTNRLGLAQVTIGGREWLVVIGPLEEDGLSMPMLRYAEELRKPEDFFDEVPPEKPSKEMVDLAVQLISQKTTPVKPEKFEDHYHTALQELVKAKLKGRKIIATPETRDSGDRLDDIYDQALRDYLKKKGQPVGLEEAFAQSARQTPANDRAPAKKHTGRMPCER